MKRFVLAALALSATASMALATGTIIPVNVAGTPSHDGAGAAGNAIMNINVATALGLPNGTPCTMNGIGWDVSLFADPAVGSFGGSWLSELTAGFGPAGGPNAVNLRPGAGSNVSGTGSFSSPVLKFNTIPLPDIALPNGILRIEFFESFDDAAGVDDGRWVSGVLNVQAVPEPASFGLLALGGLALLRRR